MKKRSLALATVFGILAVASLLIAQTRPSLQQLQGGPGAKGLVGIWDMERANRNDPDALSTWTLTKEDLPMLPWAAAQYKKVRSGSGPLRQQWDKGPDAVDPSHSCFPLGPTRAYCINRPFEIREVPGMILILFEWDHAIRRVYTDGREHPDGYPVSFMGHSTGKWEGDTLVVDTVALRDETWIDGLGHPHTEDLHIVERYKRTGNTLQIDFWFEDPKTYTKPWTGKKRFTAKEKDFEMMEHNLCEDFLKMGTKRMALDDGEKSPY